MILENHGMYISSEAVKVRSSEVCLILCALCSYVRWTHQPHTTQGFFGGGTGVISTTGKLLNTLRLLPS